MSDIKISAVITTYNSERHIAACLNALRGLADEIIVVDSFSTDSTVKICRANPFVFLLQKEWEGYAATKNYGNALAKYDYILSIDADEVLSDTLRDNIMEEKMWLKGAYAFKRRNHIGDKAVKYCGWYPDEKVRLFPWKTAHWVGDYVHETLKTDEKIRQLAGDLLHYSFADLTDMRQRFRKYAELGAVHLLKKQVHPVSPFKVYLTIIYKFLNIFVLKLGFLEGYLGYKISIELASSVAHKYRVLAALQKQSKDQAFIPPQYFLKEKSIL
jgi:glycosyltransferase involved in cell wall biosynthesis